MKSVKLWGGLGPYDEDEGYEYHWYNKCYEHDGTRFRLLAGDLLASDEDQNGGSLGPHFGFDLRLAQEDIPEFYVPGHEDAKYDIHYFTFVFWRWGIYFSVRGKLYDK